MGKALVVGAVIVIIAVLITVVVLYLQREPVKGDMTRKEERDMRQLLNRAARIMLETGQAQSIEDSDVLSTRTATAMDTWLRDHNNFIKKEINA